MHVDAVEVLVSSVLVEGVEVLEIGSFALRWGSWFGRLFAFYWIEAGWIVDFPLRHLILGQSIRDLILISYDWKSILSVSIGRFSVDGRFFADFWMLGDRILNIRRIALKHRILNHNITIFQEIRLTAGPIHLTCRLILIILNHG